MAANSPAGGLQGIPSLEDMKKRRVACDFEIRVEDGNFVAVHRAVLIATSKYFEILFLSDSEKVRDGYIVVRDLTIRGIECCIEYIYTGKIQITSSNATSTLEVANTWQLNHLVQICGRYLQNGISPDISMQKNATLVMLDAGTGILTSLDVENRQYSEISRVPNFKKGDFVKITVISGELHLLHNKMLYKYESPNWRRKATLQQQPGPPAQLVKIEDHTYCVGKKKMSRYYPTEDIWIELLPGCELGSDFCTAASQHFIHAFGGFLGWYKARRFYPESGKWLKATAQKYPRRGAAAAFYQGKIFVLGGSGILTNERSVECYDPRNDEWSDLADLNRPRAWCAAAVHNDKLYAIGGWPDRNTVEVYNQDKNRWEGKGQIPEHVGIISVCVCNL